MEVVSGMSAAAPIELGILTDRYEALLRASAAIADCEDCDSFQQRFRTELARLISFDYIHGLIFEDGTSAVCKRMFDSLVRDGGEELPVEDTTSWFVHQQQQVMSITDWEQESRFASERELLQRRGIASTVTLPLATPHRKLGSITVGSTRPEAFGEEEVSLLSLLVSHVALTIDDTLNFEASQFAQTQLQRKNEQLELVLDLTNRVVSNLELREVLRAVAASVRRVMESHGVAVMLPTADGNNLQVFALDAPRRDGGISEEALIPIDSPAGRVFNTAKPAVASVHDIAAADPQKYRAAAAEGFTFFCHVPLVSRAHALGVLALGRKGENPFAQDEIDFLMKVAGQIAIAIENALAYREIAELKEKLAQEKLYLEDEIRGEVDFEGIVGQSSALRHVLQLVETVAPSDSTVLLLGETGTGKERIARAIHDRSRRKERTFVKLNCAAIPTGLLESELFGHEKGAFTGAIAQRLGRLELADQGSLFLDEVGDIPLELQPKLLRALQEREFERLGSTHTKKVNVRLVAATNRNLEKMIADGQFRSDLFYRLNVFPIRIPPLRERPEDIPLLVRYFAQKYARRMEKRIDSVPASALKKLARWHWPGNIRELENFIERAVILTRGSVLEIPVGELKSGAPVATLRANADSADRDRIVSILRDTKGRVGGDNGAAARLGIKRTTLISRMSKLGIDPRALS
jgi:formate hydrogenlyase transcriptional activator